MMTVEIEERQQRVSWLELFFDLVFVVVIQQLTHMLHGSPDLVRFLLVGGLAVIVWTCWLNVTLLANVTGGVTARDRPFILLSMAGIALIAISLPDVDSSTALLFATGYAVARVSMWPLWLKNRGDLSWWGATLFGPGLAAAWLLAVLLPEAGRWSVWAVLLVAEVFAIVKGLPSAHRNANHMLERVGLFIMIVLGEALVQLILSVQLNHSPEQWIVAAIGFTIICALWWVYFDLGARAARAVRNDTAGTIFRDVLVADHFIFVLALIFLAAGLGSAIGHAAEAHLEWSAVIAIAGGTALFYVAQVLTAVRYGAKVASAVSWTAPSVVISLGALTIGTVSPPWLVVAVILFGTILHIGIGAAFRRPATSRRPH